MRKTDFFMGVIWLMVGLGISWKAHSLGIGSLRHPGLGLTPFMIGVFLVMLSICILFTSHDVKGAVRNLRSIWEEVRVKTIGLVVLYLIGYGFLIERMGYLITTFFFFLLVLKTISSMRFRTSVVFSLCSVVVSYALFVIILKVPLPSGLWRIG